MRLPAFILLLLLSFVIHAQEAFDRRQTDSLVSSLDRKLTGGTGFYAAAKENGQKAHYLFHELYGKLGKIVRTVAGKEKKLLFKFYLDNGSLVYAVEEEVLYFGKDSSRWAGYYYFRNGKMVDHETLGHGKSESDTNDWDPESEALAAFRKAVREVELYKRSRSKEERFEAAVQEIIRAFSGQDSKLLSKYINKETGVHLLHRVGVHDNFKTFHTISFSDDSHPALLFGFYKGIRPQPLQYARLPEYDCAAESWSRRGLFVDTARTDHPLSGICRDRNKFGLDNIPDKEIQSYICLEKRSRRVVLADRNDKDLVFYLTWLDGRWWLTIVDTVTSDCSV